MNFLFVCRANLQRSPTAEQLFKNSKHNAKSPGISPLADTQLTEKAVKWADIIFVMEKYMKDFIFRNFEVKNKKIIVLNIPDIYVRNDLKLIKKLKKKLKKYL